MYQNINSQFSKVKVMNGNHDLLSVRRIFKLEETYDSNQNKMF